MSTNEELVLRAEQAAAQVATDKAAIQAMVTKLEEVQAPSIAASKEDIRQAIIEKGVECADDVALSEYGNKVRAITTAGGSDSDNKRTLLYMPMNGNLDIYGDLKITSCICEQYNEMDMAVVDWTPTFSDDGVFEGEKCFSLEKTVVSEDDWNPPSFCKVWLPINSNYIKDDFTLDLWMHKLPYVEGEDRIARIDIAYTAYINLRTANNGETSVTFYLNPFVYTNNSSFRVSVNDTWNHIAFVREGDSLYFFLNGVLLGESAITGFRDISYGLQPYKDRRCGIGSLSEEKEIKTAHLRLLNYALWTENFTPPTKESYTQYAK